MTGGGQTQFLKAWKRSMMSDDTTDATSEAPAAATIFGEASVLILPNSAHLEHTRLSRPDVTLCG